jgi:YD repeat-containing protein
VPTRSRSVLSTLLFAIVVASLDTAAAAAPLMTSARATPPKRIPVTQPSLSKRRPFSPISKSAFRTRAVQSVRPPAGRRVDPPLMLRPREIDRVLEAARHRAAMPEMRSPDGAHSRPVAPNAGRGASPRNPGGATRSTRTLATASLGTGIKPWWPYHDMAVPGDGRGLVNVGTGNVLLQEFDMAVPHKGVSLTYQRTYNSQSQHDVAGTDGTEASMYGNGWTSSFDAHISGSQTGPISVFDVDGARYDYALAGDGVTRIPPPGQHATLTYDGGCGYLWTKKSGPSYYFWIPDVAPGCPSWWFPAYGAYAGRTYQIIGRNRNTYVTFYYSWDNGNSAPGVGKISQVQAQTESGLTTTLSFVDFNGHRLLQTLTYPDNATAVYYGYDAQGNLVYVNRPPNNAAGNRPGQGYGYQALGSGTVIYWTASPRWMASGGADGGYTAFLFNGSVQSSSTVWAVGRAGVMNPTIPDGSSSQVLQPAFPGGAQTYIVEYYTTGVATPTFSDTDGHAVNWVVDSLQRPTQTQVATSTSTFWGTTYTNYLVSNFTWDANDNLVAFVNPAGFETDAAYDAAGNIVALADPPTSVINSNFSYSSYRPTRLLDYDAYSNVVAFCDAAETYPAGGNWNGQYSGGSDSYCTSLLGNANHQRMLYAYPSYEPYGELTSIVAPSGYMRTIAYDAGSQGGADYGLPTRIFGTSVTQLDGTGRTPSQSAVYDANGNTLCVRADSASGAATVMSYDALNRVVAMADPDDASTSPAACSKTPGLAGSTIVSSLTYFPDGSVASTQTPAEAARSAGTAYVYDLDGNQLQQAPYSPNPQSTLTPTLKRWFDGADRLVETSVPTDPNTSGDFPLLIRYIYDISMGGAPTTLSGASVSAHGNLFEVQKNKPSGWLDFRYAAFDLDDRMTASYAFAPCPAGSGSGPVYCTQTPFATQYTWDRAGGFDNTGTFAYGLPGLLAQITDALGVTKSFAYDADSRVTSIQYGDNVTPYTGFGYDPDGRVNFSYWPANYATNTSEYQYSADGQLAQTRDDYTSSTTSYSYYPDAMLAGVSAATTSLVSQSNLYAYSYRNDGALQRETFGASNQTVSLGYTPGGRPTTMTDFNSSPSVSQTYDAHGQLASVITPAGTYGSITHDALDNVLQYTAFNGVTVANQYNVRGDLIGRTYSPNPVDPSTGNPTYPAFAYRDVQGVLVQSASDQYDGLTGAPLVIGGYPMAYDTIGRMVHSGAGNTATYAYDAEGRIVAGDTTTVSRAGDANCATGGALTPTTSRETSYVYDGRGDMSQDAFTSAGRSYSRQWYWDRGAPLYTATGLGTGVKALDGFQADSIGAIPANGGVPGLTIADVDLDGTVAVHHNNTGYSAWYASNVFHQECVSSNPVPASAGYVDPFAASTTPVDDGSSDPSLSVTSRGRVFLSTAMGYTTPDYSSVTPYSSSRRGTLDYCRFNPVTGHFDLIRRNDGHNVDACGQINRCGDASSPQCGFLQNPYDPFGIHDPRRGGGGGGSGVGPLKSKRVNCPPVQATFTAVGPGQALANGALYSDYPKEVGGSIKGGTFGTVAVKDAFLGLSDSGLRTYGTQIFVTPGNQGLIARLGGPTGPLSVSDKGNTDIQNTPGVAFDIYRFPTMKGADEFGRKKMSATISFPAASGGSCP